jgi:hypothetical protein
VIDEAKAAKGGQLRVLQWARPLGRENMHAIESAQAGEQAPPLGFRDMVSRHGAIKMLLWGLGAGERLFLGDQSAYKTGARARLHICSLSLRHLLHSSVGSKSKQQSAQYL